MSDYDMQIIVIVVFASVLFSGFLHLYAQEPTVDYVQPGDYSQNLSESNNVTDVKGAFDMMDVFGGTGIFLVELFFTAMAVIAVIIILRFLWW